MVSDSPEGGIDDREQYDVTTWEERTRLDHLAVGVSRFVGRWWVFLAAVVAVLFAAHPLATIGSELVQYPWLIGVVLLSLLVGLLIIRYIRRINPMTISHKGLVVTFLLGGAFAGFAILIEGSLQPVIEALPVVGTAMFFLLVVGPIEELVKWAAVRLYAFERSSFQTALDGALYGAVAGLGFAALESSEYIARAVAQGSASDPALSLAVGGAIGRVPAVPFHVVLTALAGYYLGLAKANPESYAPIVIKGLLIAAVLHGIYDTLVTYLPGVIGLAVAVVYVSGIGLLLYKKLSRYRQQAPSGGSPAPTTAGS
ncbi:PrsW family intramembrane metalloprotease [Natrinema soli]|uniref:PrsW family intramembrane metalloprotease n=1 Tax=Natrinema soli TaxID=1930624 RepID=A0ABD5SJG1_9EURY|nr:PrsW family intramembrane metalloprotease [Natrinema soli]